MATSTRSPILLLPGMRLPYELYKMIITEVDLPHRNAFRPLLTVSRSTYEIVAPLLYQSIFMDTGKPDKDTFDLFGSCASVSAQKFPRLTRAFKQNTKLGTYTSTLIIMHMFDKACIVEMLGCLRSLRRLFIACHLDEDIEQLLHSLPHLGSLTHLLIPTFSENSPIPHAIQAVAPSLRFLSLRGCSSLPSEHLACPMTSLETFISIHGSGWDTLVDNAPIKHLSTVSLSSDDISHPQDVFASTVTLKVFDLLLPDTLLKYAPYLRNLRMIHLSFMYNDSEIRIQDLKTIASPFLSYIHFNRLPRTRHTHSVNPSELPALRELFHSHPHLLAVDVTYKAPISRAYLSRHEYTFRLLHNQESPQKVHIREAGIFEGWWEPLKEDLGISF